MSVFRNALRKIRVLLEIKVKKTGRSFSEIGFHEIMKWSLKGASLVRKAIQVRRLTCLY